MVVVKYIFTCIFCYLISGIVHELGHIAVGLANGWKFWLLVIGPLGIKADDNGKIKFYFEKNITLWGGIGATVPRRIDNNNIKIWSNVLLGGPLASIIMGVIFLPIGLMMNNIFLIVLGAMPLSMGIISGLPLSIRTGILFVDGKRWYRLHNGGQEAKEEIALFNIVEHLNTRGNYSTIKLSSIEALINSKEVGIRYYGYYSKYQYYKELKCEEEMIEIIKKIEDIKDKAPKIIVEDCKIN
ncbi:MAG: hypothetical protein FH753_16075 [Firmicutes bacterium]|nr:hypothetical protein [Bacillota bacterium]